MAIDANAVGVKGEPSKRSWTSKDALLYAVGIGAGLDDVKFATENTKDVAQKVYPTFAVIIGGGGIPINKVGSFNPALMVHGEQGIELLGEIPADGEIESVGECTAIYDKGSAAVLEFASESKNLHTGEVILRTRTSLFCRGEGGFGGERGENAKVEFPDRSPDHQMVYQTREDQALIYRLSGDRNPLHSDPSFAKMGGFDRPILHGLCTYGYTGRGLLAKLCDSDPSRFKSMNARFSKPVYPGDELTVSMWVDGKNAQFKTTNQDGDVVIDQGQCSFA